MSKSTKIIAALGVVAGLGVAAMPLSSYATATTGTAASDVSKQVGVQIEIEDILELTPANDNSSNKVIFDKQHTTGTYTEDMNINVKSNAKNGYKLSVEGSGTGAGTNGKTALTNEFGAEILSTTGTKATPVELNVNATKSAWGYKLATTTGGYIGFTTNKEEVLSTTKPTADAGDDNVVTFGIYLADGQESGTYNGEVTFTASNNAR